MKNVIVNAMPDDTFIAVKAQYNHTSMANVIRGGVCDLSYPTSTKRRSRSKDLGQISGTLTSHEFNRMELVNMDGQEKIRIRRLTPKECWRLMGFSDEDFYKAQAVNSDTQLYKQAGNSICVCCLEEIIKNLF